MDYDEIIQKRVRRIARDHGCSIAEVNTALDLHPIELDCDTFLKRTLAMELVELDELKQACREKALVDRDTSAGVLVQSLPPLLVLLHNGGGVLPLSKTV
jgi:DNA-binding transcriptional MerR regulator